MSKRPCTCDRVPGAANIALYTQGMCSRHLGREEEAAELLRRVYSRDPKFTPAREALDNPSFRLVLTDPETIEARTDPWDPDSAPTRAQTEAARHAEAAPLRRTARPRDGAIPQLVRDRVPLPTETGPRASPSCRRASRR